MDQYFTTKHDLMRAFAKAMNLVDPVVQHHHEQVAYLAGRLAELLELTPQQKRLAVAGALVHDIGGIMAQNRLSVADLEQDVKALAIAGPALLRAFPYTAPLAEIVRESQQPWQRLASLPARLKSPRQIGQIIHLADRISILLDGAGPVLNQVFTIRDTIRREEGERLSPEVLQAFERLCGWEVVWMDVLYRPQQYLEIVSANQDISLDDTVIFTEFMSRIIDLRSPFTAMHSAGVAATAVCLAELAGMSDTECRMMRIAGNLHDVGKMKIPNAILEKPGKLTQTEFNVMKEHPYYTYLILKDIRGFEQITAWAALHHEKLSGSGYPFHLEAGEISLGSRIMAVADIFSAITEDRPYRRGMEREKAIAVLREDAARGQISGDIVELLIRHYADIDARRDAESKAASKKYQRSLNRASLPEAQE